MPQDDLVEDGEDKENKAENGNKTQDDVTVIQQTETSSSACKELDEDVLRVLGEDPLASRALELSFHPAMLARWKFWAVNGVAKQEMDDVLSKYARQEGLDAPGLNLEVTTNLSDPAVKRDKFTIEKQWSVGATMTAVGSTLSMFLEEDESIDKLTVVERLGDSMKMLSDLQFRLTESRKAFILPGLSKQSRDVLTASKTDELLFGRNLAERLKESRALDKVSQSIKQQPRASTYNNRQHLNGKGLPGKRAPYNQAGSGGPSNQNRPRLFFKSKQQFFNPRAQTQRTPKFKGKGK